VISTKEKLAQVLHAAGLFDLEALARLGRFDDFESESATPIVDLVVALEKANQHALAERARNGEFDASKEEAEKWYASSGHHLLKK